MFLFPTQSFGVIAAESQRRRVAHWMCGRRIAAATRNTHKATRKRVDIRGPTLSSFSISVSVLRSAEIRIPFNLYRGLKLTGYSKCLPFWKEEALLLFPGACKSTDDMILIRVVPRHIYPKEAQSRVITYTRRLYFLSCFLLSAVMSTAQLPTAESSRVSIPRPLPFPLAPPPPTTSDFRAV